MQRRRLAGAWSVIWRSFSCAIWVFWACVIGKATSNVLADHIVVSTWKGQAHLNRGVELLEVRRYVVLHVVLQLPPQNL
jgi:hypothetical protein